MARTRAGRRPASDDVARALLRSPLWPLRPVVSCRRAFRPDRPLRPLAQLPRDRDPFAGQHQPRRVEQDLVLCGADLALDDVDGKILAVQQAGDAVPD